MEPTTPHLLTGNATVDHWLAVLGVVLTVSSTAASFLNGKIRAAIDAEGEAPPLFLYAALVFNYAAFNADKAMQIHKLLRGTPVKVLTFSNDKNPPSEPPHA
jgi:hypothetical protein